MSTQILIFLRKHKFWRNATAVFLVGCFLFVAHVQAAEIDEEALQKEQQSKGSIVVICNLDSQALKKTQKDSENKLMTSICSESEKVSKKSSFAIALRDYVKGYPIEQMTDDIAQLDPTVAAYMIAMAKQESNWGKRVPVLNGQDCFNYWGFRSKRARMGSGGHTCFDSPQDAVETVAARVHELVYDYGRTTPRQMLIWKCGSSCATHDRAGVERWVSVISRYHIAVTKLVKETAV